MGRNAAAWRRGATRLGGVLAVLAYVVLAYVAAQDAHAEACEMTPQRLSSFTVAELRVDIIGTPVLCLAQDGYGHLAPHTATAEITNLDQQAEITYALAPLRGFRSTAVWPAAEPDASVVLTPPPAAGAETRVCVLGPGATCRISSWRRHHDAIWTMAQNRGGAADGAAEDYTVRFDLSFVLAWDDEPVVVSRQVDISFEVRSPP